MNKIKRKIIVAMVALFAVIGGVNVVTTQAATLTLKSSEVALIKGKTKKLEVATKPANSAKVTWRTSNKYAVSVSKNGKIKALNYGTAIITATCKKQKATCFVQVPNSKTKVSLDTENKQITEGETFTLLATVNGKAAKAKFYSENTAIATVNSKGVVTAKNSGITYVVAYTKTGYAVCEIDVASTEIISTDTTTSVDNNILLYNASEDNYSYGELTGTVGNKIILKATNSSYYPTAKVEWNIDNAGVVSAPTTYVAPTETPTMIPTEAGTTLVSETTESSSMIETTRYDQNVNTTVMMDALKTGTTSITAKITDTLGNETVYTRTIYVSDPSLNASSINIYTGSAGIEREQYINLTGLSEKSKITCVMSDYNLATSTVVGSKIRLSGNTAGTGILTVTVDGKPLTCTIIVNDVVFDKTYASVKVGKTKQIKITGTGTMSVSYKSRNNKIAKVSSTGLVTAVSTGNTYINVKIGAKTFIYRVEVIKASTNKIIKRATYIVNNWTYSQPKRMSDNYYDCSSLVWKGYKAYKGYNKKLGSTSYALTAAGLFDYLKGKSQIISYGYTGVDDMKAGDLIFYGDYDYAVAYSTPGRTLDIYHVAMYAGNGKVVEKGGQTLSYNGTYHIVGIGRPLK